jgi:hypothetical protein
MDMTLKPGDFPIGSVESRAAMRALLEGQKGALIPVWILGITSVERCDCDLAGPCHCEHDPDYDPPAIYSECDPKLVREGDPITWMTRQELETKKRESKELERERLHESKEQERERKRAWCARRPSCNGKSNRTERVEHGHA